MATRGHNSRERATLTQFSMYAGLTVVMGLLTAYFAFGAAYEVGLSHGIYNTATFANGFKLVEGKTDFATALQSLVPQSKQEYINGLQDSGYALGALVVTLAAGARAKNVYNRL